MELGPKDLAGGTVVLVRRDTGAKTPVPWADVATAVPRLLKTIHVGHGEASRAANFSENSEHVPMGRAQRVESR
jgi:hypothetical protein